VVLDETGHSFIARPASTWARRAKRPLLKRISKRRVVSSVVVVTLRGKLYTRHFRGSINDEKLIRALKYFRRRIGRPLLIVWDGLPAHHSKRMLAFLAAHRGDFAIAVLPGYAPELNPEEECNAMVKGAMRNVVPESIEELERHAKREFRRLQYQPKLIRSFFRHAGL
jgi:transposase